MKRLPDAEFEIMKAVWLCEPPITAADVTRRLGEEKTWKAQTVISLMQRLIEREFLRTEKNGKERTYFPLITKEEYLNFETGNFMRQYHESSVLNLVNALYNDKALTEADIDELLEWTKEKRL